MTNLSDYQKYYRTADADITELDISVGKIGYGPFGRIVGRLPVPTDIEGLVTWLDGANAGVVAQQWDDLSGEDNHWTSTSAALFPTYDSGDDSMRFSDDQIDGLDMSSFTEAEIFYVLKVDSESPSDAVSGLEYIGIASTATFKNTHYPWQDGTPDMTFGSNQRIACSNPTQSLLQYHILNMYSANNDWLCKVAGEQIGSSGTSTPEFTSTTRIGRSEGSYWMRGNIKAVLIFNRKLTTLERNQMNVYLESLL